MLWAAMVIGVGVVGAKLASIERSHGWAWGVGAAAAAGILGSLSGVLIFVAPVAVILGEMSVLSWLRTLESQRGRVGVRARTRRAQEPWTVRRDIARVRPRP